MTDIIPHEENNEVLAYNSGPLTPQKMIDDICMTFRNGLIRSLRLSTEDYNATWRPIEGEIRLKLNHLAVLSAETAINSL